MAIDKRFTIICGGLVNTLAFLTLLGWITHRHLLASVFHGYIPMAPSTATIFLILGSYLLMEAWLSSRPFARVVEIALSGLVLVFCLLVIFDIFTGIHLHLESIFVSHPEKFGQVVTGRISPITAFNFILISTALIIQALSSKKLNPDLSGGIISAAFLCSGVVLLGYLYGTPLLYGGTIIPVALTTDLGFFFLSCGALASLGKEVFPMRLFVGSSSRALLLRAFFPITLFALLASNMLVRLALGRIVTNVATQAALQLLLTALVVGFAVAEISKTIGTRIDTAEQNRDRAEEALKEGNRSLQQALTQLESASKILIQQERLRAMGTMASGIAHDFNNALSPILGYTELLLTRPENLENREKVRHYLTVISNAAQDAGSVVNRLREFYRHREDDEAFNPVDIESLIARVISFSQPRWKDQALARGKTVNMKTDLKPPLPPIMGNSAELREALVNLIFNAVDAMPNGGTITLRAREEGGQALFEVSDTGTGMTDEVLKRCMEPFYTTKGEEGTGLGLAMISGIVQRHGGAIGVRSKVGEGTTFSISFPIQSPVIVHMDEGVSRSTNRPLRILVVEDEPLVREITQEFLSCDGHRVETACNGKEALEKFHPDRYDLIITDRGMPEISGDMVAEQVKKQAPGKPVIMLSGYGALIGSDEIPPGVDEVVAKPVKLATLREAVSKVMEKSNIEEAQKLIRQV